MKYKLVIFDFDGTVADTRHIILTTMQATISEMGLQVASDEQCATTIGLPLWECFKHIYPSITLCMSKTSPLRWHLHAPTHRLWICSRCWE